MRNSTLRATILPAMLTALAAAGLHCSDSPAASGLDASVTPDAGTPADGSTIATPMRDGRYCEILLGTLSATGVSFDVYNTWGLNDCPAAAWSALTVAGVQTETHSAVARINGPRYWMQDRFEAAMLLDPTPRTIGGIPMRLGGRVSVSLADAAGPTTYRTRTIQRDTVTVFDAAKPVYELVDPMGRVFTMQSYSVQVAADLTAATLPGVGARLQLPTGWQFRTRVLAAPLRVVATGGMATVVQDDLANTYILSSG